jgi:hypothetical protein
VYVTGWSAGDYATIKYDSDGNELWVARYQGGAFSNAVAIALDVFGNAYVTGSSAGDYATVKYDSDGNQLWVARYHSERLYSTASAMVLDATGNVYVTGSIWGDSSSHSDYATVKYDSDGNQLWVARYNGPASLDDVAHAIAVDTTGNVYITGGSCTLEAMDGCAEEEFATIKYSQQ